MILDFEDGRELKLPDEMPDETARILKKWILALEERAANAEAQCAKLGEQLAKSEVKSPEVASNDGVLEALQALRLSVENGFKQMVRAQMADVILVKDEISGEPRGSRKVM